MPGSTTGDTRSRATAALWLAALWLAALSVIAVLPDGFTRWVLPKDALLAVAAAAGAWAVGRGRLPRWCWAVLGAGAGILLIATLASDAPLAQLWGRYPRYEGLVTLPVYVAAAWLGARLLGPGTDPVASTTSRQHERALATSTGQRASTTQKEERSVTGRPGAPTAVRALSVVALMLGVVTFLEALGLRPLPSDLARPGALLGNATDQGLVAAMLAIVLLGYLGCVVSRPTGAGVRWDVWLASAGAAAALATVAASQSRAALLAAAVGLVVLAIVSPGAHPSPAASPSMSPSASATGATGARSNSRVTTAPRAARPSRPFLRRLALGGIPLVVLATLALSLETTRARLLGTSPLASSTIDDRWDIWRSAAQLLGEHPVFGVGPSGLLDAVGATYDPAASRLGTTTVLDSPHSWVLQAGVAGGWPLLLLAAGAAVALLVVGVRTALRERHGGDWVPAAALAAVTACGLGLGTHVTGTGTVILGCLLGGALVARPPRDGATDARPTVTRTLRPALLTAWALALTVTTLTELPLAGAVAQAGSDPAAADAAFTSVAALRPWDADLASIAAESFAAASDAAAAAATTTAPDGTPLAASLAVAWATRSLERTPHTEASLVALGVGLQGLGQLPEAEAAFSEAVVRNAASATPVFRRGYVRALQGNFEAARDDLLTATDRDPTRAEPWAALAFVYQELGDPAAADAANARALALAPPG